MKDGHVQQLNFTDEFLLDAVEKRLATGNYLGALTMLNKRNGLYDNSCDASVLAAEIYEGLGLPARAIDAWFHFLDTCNEADFAEGYEGLASNFMNIGNELQSAHYYHKLLGSDADIPSEGRVQIMNLVEQTHRPALRLVWSADGDGDFSDRLSMGLEHLKNGDPEKARECLLTIPEGNKDFVTAGGLAAMCALMIGETEKGIAECEDLLETKPDDVQLLTTYCAALSDLEDKSKAREVAMRLFNLKPESTDDLYRIATALCETGMDEEAYIKLTELKTKLPFDNNVLYFHAVSAYRTGRREEAIESLELLTTVSPRSAVAEYYLERMREEETGVPTTYFYRLPPEEYANLVSFFTTINKLAPEDNSVPFDECLWFLKLAFDEMDGRDDKLQLLAAESAANCRADAFLREVLLNYEGSDFVKFYILHRLSMRNEENSYGTVICNLYKEFFVHKISIGTKKKKEFMTAFADVYSKFALLGEELEAKICTAAEGVYRHLASAGQYDLMDDREALAAAIYRESYLHHGAYSLEKIADLFGTKVSNVEKILNFVI